MSSTPEAAEAALAQSGLKVEQLNPQQKAQALAAVQAALPAPASGGLPGETMLFSINVGCIACKAALNVLGGAAIAAALAAGVAVGPEATVVVAIAEFFGVDATAVAAFLTRLFTAGAGASVEGVIAALCQEFGACS